MADQKVLRHPIRNAFFILLIITTAIYANNYNASWHMDDYHNIVMNPKLQIDNLWPSSLHNIFFSNFGNENKLYRPLSCFTFALNWYMGGNHPFWFHLTNNAIHVLTAFFLFLFILKLFETPRLRDLYKGDEYFIALLAACFWAINPIQTQAVTYIVQRMASLAALLYIISMIFYLTGRMAKSISNKIILFSICFLSFLLALASKENAITLPVALLVVEFTFFRPHTKKKSGKVYTLLITAILLFIPFLIIVVKSNPDFFLNHYDIRSFTPLQRFLTEPRILLFYISLFFYPIPSRLSIIHDIEVSTSLFYPWTTLLSIIFVLLLICYAAIRFRKQPLVSFAIIFFFINHTIESSFIGLELIFEHRNYLPTFFLFLPAASGFKKVIDYYQRKNQLIYFMLVSFMIVMLTGIGIGTYIRNIVWATEKSLWEDAMEKAPFSARPPHNLAWGHYDLIKDYDKAFELYQKSLNLYWPNKRHRSHAFYGMAGISYKKKEYKKAAELYQEAKKIDPYDEMSQKQLLLTLIKLRKWEEAMKQVNHLLSFKPSNTDYLNYKGSLLLKLKEYQSAITYFKKSLKQNRLSVKSIFGIGKALEGCTKHGRAMWFYKLAHLIEPNNTDTLLFLIDVNIEAENREMADIYMDKLLSLVSAYDLRKVLMQIDDDHYMNLISKERIITISSRRIQEASKEINFSEVIADVK